ncbi:MAG: adenosylcobalamin-dependent ribonucleoside-diphosphate reductase [Pseudomonadota bacterium]
MTGSEPDLPRSQFAAAGDWPQISHDIWRDKYRFDGGDSGVPERTIEETWARVAKGAAAAETAESATIWEARFRALLADFAFLPAGRILAGVGTGRDVTLFNCFVMNRIEDDLGAIFENVREAALTMQGGGGIGHDFSTLRPAGAPVVGVGSDASGPLSFMDVWDTMCRTIMSAGARRGAMMGTLRCDHPDIEAFIDAKGDASRLRNFNLSVLVTDAFVEAVRKDTSWDLVFDGKVYSSVRAVDLWDRIMRATYAYAEPGVIFIDRVNALSNLAYCETISTTNPCGEQPLPPYGACLLGSINLAALVDAPFTDDAALDETRLQGLVGDAVRFLDNIIDVSKYPLEAQRLEAKSKRRIGLGITGLANALAMTGVRYGTTEAAERAGAWMALIQNTAYRTSASLAEEKGAFPLYDADAFSARPSVLALDKDVRDAIAKNGLRNGILTSIAPTGTISLLAGNVSGGIEPTFAHTYARHVLQPDGSHLTKTVTDAAARLYWSIHGLDASLPDACITAHDLSPEEHLRMQAALQPHVDSAISKTINCPRDISFDDFKDIYLAAYDAGLKGCTTYRENEITGSVLATTKPQTEEAARPKTVSNSGRVPSSSDELASTAATVAGPMHVEHQDGIVYMTEPLERDEKLVGATYKVKWPSSVHALYITINDLERDGRRRPFEIFINTKNLEHHAWIVALTRMISAVFRRGGDVSFVAAELKEIFDPRGGHWMGGRYVPSLIAAIGNVIESHMHETGFLKRTDPDVIPVDVARAHAAQGEVASVNGMASRAAVAGDGAQIARDDASRDGSAQPSGSATTYVEGLTRGSPCPHCQTRGLTRQEGCWVCVNCGFSQCS